MGWTTLWFVSCWPPGSSARAVCRGIDRHINRSQKYLPALRFRTLLCQTEKGSIHMKTDTLQALYLKELRDLYGSEKLLAKWLPKTMEMADLIELRQALSHHLSEVRSQTTRLEKIFQLRGEKPAEKKSKVLEGILHEADEDIADAGSSTIR